MYIFNGHKTLGQFDISMIPGAETAINTIKAKVGEFFGLPIRIQNAIKKTITLNKAAQEKGMNIQASELAVIKSALDRAKSIYDNTEGKLKTLLDGLKSSGVPGFGVVPIALGLLAITVVAGVTGLIKYVNFQEKKLDAIQNKVLTPQEAQSLFGFKPFGISFGGVTSILLIGGIGLSIWAFMRRK